MLIGIGEVIFDEVLSSTVKIIQLVNLDLRLDILSMLAMGDRLIK